MRILIASDLSAASDEAVKQGLRLANGSDDSLAICHVLHRASRGSGVSAGTSGDLEMALEMDPHASKLLRAQAERVAAGGRTPREVFVEQGYDASEIASRAERWRADLLVVGSHGRGAGERLPLGSVAEQLVRRAPCTVLVARACRPGCVLVAVDLSDASLANLETGASAARRLARELVVTHVLEPARRESDAALALLGTIAFMPTPEQLESRRTLSLEIVQNALARQGLADACIELATGRPLDEILRLAQSLPAELVVVRAKLERSMPRVLGGGGTATELVRSAPCSVLAVRSRA